MTKLIIYIDSEQKASAYCIEDNNSSSILCRGKEDESNLAVFSENVLSYLRATSLDEMEKWGGISVLIVSNGATNESIRSIMGLFLHDTNKDGVLNVNIQELNVIEAKYILPLIGNPPAPHAKEFQSLYSLENLVNQKEMDELKSINSKLMEEISVYKKTQEKILKENAELHDLKNLVIKKIEAHLSEFMQSGTLCKIDFNNDSEKTGKKLPVKQNEIAIVKISNKDGSIVSKDAIIASYHIGRIRKTDFNKVKKITDNTNVGILVGGIVGFVAGVHSYSEIIKDIEDQTVNIYANQSGKIFYYINNIEPVHDGDVIAVIGKETWTKDDADFFLKNASIAK